MIIPVPSRPAARRQRGADRVGDLAREAARRVRAGGGAVRVLPALHLVRDLRDQAGLGRVERRSNLAGALAVRASAARAVAGRCCIVVDDVITTGVTVREASRAIGAAGGVVVAVAACCATPLRGGLSGGARLH